MLRNRAVALFLSCTASSLAFALGLGSLESDSSLNEPFSGRIDILGAAPEDFDTLTVTLADAEQFARAGIERNPALFGLRFAIDDSVPGEDFIRVTSKDPIREPYLNFLVELNWANGRLVREYTVLLDPPLYDPDRRRAVFAPAPAAPAAAAPAAAPAPAATAPTPSTPPPAAAPPATTRGYVAGREIGPVVATDTLWSIASAARPHDGITVQQMMLALLRANPAAFGEDNVNLLRRGAVLRLPAQDELTAMDARAAYAEVQRHNQLWERYRGQVAAAPETQPVGAAAPSTAFELDALDDDSARLELVAPGDAEGSSTPGRAGTGGGAELLREEVEARAQQAAELESKLVEAEGIIDLLQRQVNIKDEELAALQARLAELGVEQEELGLEERADALVDDAREALAELDETLPDAPDIDPGMTLDDAFGADLLDEAPAGDDTAPETTAAAGEPVAEATPQEELAAAPATGQAQAEPAPAKPKPKPAAKQAPPPQPERAFPANLVPEHIAALVPGGSFTVLGAGALLVLGIVIGLVTSVMRRRGGKEEAPAAAAAPAVAAATVPPVEEQDPSEALTEVGASDATEEPTSFDPNATVEAESEETPEEFLRTQTDVAPAPAAAQEEDPLEEVNVYLAYERFDQAEELVKRVIGEHPDRHEYKLRLLEVYYSSNDRTAYEAAARDLLDAVGEDDPLWASALAMWAEMSPERELFAEGADEAAALAADTGPAFVDITAEGESDSPTESTLVQAPGEEDDNALDFDLTGTGAGDSEAGGETADDDMFDITAAADDDVLDLTAGDDADVLDLTAAAEEDVLDLSAGDEGEAADAAFDLRAGTPEGAADEDVLDITGGSDSGDTLKLEADSTASVHDLGSLEDTHDPANDLLDVTSSGDSGGLDDDNLLDLGGGDAEALDFDISDTVAPVTGGDEESGDDEGTFDITGGDDDADLLDFDIGGFDEEEGAGGTAFDTESTAELGTGGAGGDARGVADEMGETGDIDLELTRGMDEVTTRLDVTESEGDDGGLEITMSSPGGDAPDGELSLQGDELDELSLGGDDEFDLSLENTSDMDSIAAEETMEIPAGGLTPAAGDDDLGDFELDLPLPGVDETGGSGTGDTAHTDTVELDGDEALEIDPDDHSTVALPQGADVERQSSVDEADTKLNLAKAYIELGDNEGARSILAEVVADGSDAQKVEAQMLLDQMSD